MDASLSESHEPDTAQRGTTSDRILRTAFAAFIERGYAETSTLEIATRAKVSKRELYALFGSKQAMLVACIAYRVGRIRLPPDLPAPVDRTMLASTLTLYGSILLREGSHPTVIALYRLAIAEIERSPEVARTLIAAGRDATLAALADLLARAQAAGLIGGEDPVEIARQYLALLTQDLMVNLLLRVADPPGQDWMERQAIKATAALLTLHPAPALS